MKWLLRSIVQFLLIVALAAIIALSSPKEASARSVPQVATQHRLILVAEARRHWGITAPVALFAAQIHQESSWREDARSKYAIGMAQFTPPTAADMDRWYKSQLGNLARYSPLWSIRALVLYDGRIYRLLEPYGQDLPECDRFAMMLSGYNGGPTWLKRDRQLTADRGDNPDRWWDSVERHSNRATWAIEENRDYPRRIIYRHQHIYHEAWGGKWVC